jgi:hypothetical protein
MARPIAGLPLPVTLQVREATYGIGTVQIPFTHQEITRASDGRLSVAISIDQPELRRRIADLLKVTAMHFEEDPTDG